MDGTLWDAVESYCAVWNETIVHFGIDRDAVTYGELAPLMGRSLDDIYDTLIGLPQSRTAFNKVLMEQEELLMPQLGGKLYNGVTQTLQRLHSDGAQLFMVSNCSSSGLPNFLNYTGLHPLMTDTLSLGQNGRDKAHNIMQIVKDHKLKSPVYVGDTQGDCISAQAAGIPFVWASYGFGRDVHGAEYVISDISELIDLQTS